MVCCPMGTMPRRRHRPILEKPASVSNVWRHVQRPPIQMVDDSQGNVCSKRRHRTKRPLHSPLSSSMHRRFKSADILLHHEEPDDAAMALLYSKIPADFRARFLGNKHSSRRDFSFITHFSPIRETNHAQTSDSDCGADITYCDFIRLVDGLPAGCCHNYQVWSPNCASSPRTHLVSANGVSSTAKHPEFAHSRGRWPYPFGISDRGFTTTTSPPSQRPCAELLSARSSRTGAISPTLGFPAFGIC